MSDGPMKPVLSTSVEKREWRPLIFQFFLLIFFSMYSQLLITVAEGRLVNPLCFG